MIEAFVSQAMDRSVLRRLENGWYAAEVPGLDPAHAVGANPDDCLVELRAVLMEWATRVLAGGGSLPGWKDEG